MHFLPYIKMRRFGVAVAGFLNLNVAQVKHVPPCLHRIPSVRQIEEGSMKPPRRQNDGIQQLESAHVCPGCATPILIENIGLRETTTGIVTCPKCDWSGKIDIRVLRIDPGG